MLSYFWQNWDVTTDISNILNKYQLPIDSSSSKPIKQLPIDAVDELADELVSEYSNPKFRPWYCGVIYQFGFAQINEWQNRAREGKEPARLFSKYVKDARTFKGSVRSSDV